MHSFSLVLLVAFLMIVAAFVRRVIAGVRPASVSSLDLLPAEIMAEIGRAPVMEQGRAGRVYQGASVRWQVTFESAITLSPFSVRLMLQDRGEYPWVFCDVYTHRFPQLRGLVQHTPLWVSGRIQQIKADEIILKNAFLEFE